MDESEISLILDEIATIEEDLEYYEPVESKYETHFCPLCGQSPCDMVPEGWVRGELGMMNMMSRGGSVGGGGGGMLDSWGGSRRSDAIMVRNLAPDYTWQMLKDRFTHVGDIKYAEMKERGTGVIR